MSNGKEFKWDKEKAREYELHIENGREFWGSGLTTLTIKGEGSFQGTNRSRGKTVEFAGKLSDSDVSELFSDAVLSRVWRMEVKKRKGVPDESKMKLKLYHNDVEQVAIEMWEGIARENPLSKRVLDIFNAYTLKIRIGPTETTNSFFLKDLEE